MLAKLPAQPGCSRENEGEGSTPVAVGRLGHGEVKREELVTAVCPAGEPVLTGGIGEHGRGVDHEGGVQLGFAVAVCTAPQEERR